MNYQQKYQSGNLLGGLSRFFNDVILGLKYLLRLEKKEVKNIVTLEEGTLKNVNQALLEEKNKWMAMAEERDAEYKKLYRDTMKTAKINPIELLKEQKARFIDDILKRGHKIQLKKNIDVYTRDQRFKLGKFFCFSVCDGYWYLIYKRGKELDYLKAPSLDELVFNSSSIANQVKHNLLITNFIFVKGKLIRVPKRYEEYV